MDTIEELKTNLEEARAENRKLRHDILIAEQTVRNLAAWLDGDIKTIALNEAKRLYTAANTHTTFVKG